MVYVFKLRTTLVGDRGTSLAWPNVAYNFHVSINFLSLGFDQFISWASCTFWFWIRSCRRCVVLMIDGYNWWPFWSDGSSSLIKKRTYSFSLMVQLTVDHWFEAYDLGPNLWYWCILNVLPCARPRDILILIPTHSYGALEKWQG